jgi:U3 small nucleolar ribonucleoprotein component
MNLIFLFFQPAPEVTVVNNLPAILVEEIVPTTVNDSTLLAPEEVHVSGTTE